MFKRVYGITLKPDLPPGRREQLIAVLENTPAYIPGTIYSIVRPALGPGPYDLLWDNAFVNEELYQEYLAHPYHCNVIDEYMYRESPTVVSSDSLVVRWQDDGATVPSANAPRTVQQGDQPLPEEPFVSDPQQGPLVIVEQVELLPGKTDEYLKALNEIYKPMIDGKGLTQLMCLRSPPGTGEEEICILWQVASWQAFVDYRAYFQFGSEPHSTNWVKLSSSLRKGGRRRIMLQTA